MANDTLPFDPGAYFTDDEAAKVRTYYQVEAARSRNEDWDPVVNGHKWTDGQIEQVETYEGDAAQLAYDLAKEALTPTAEEIYDSDAPPVTAPEPGSAEDLYG